MLAYDEFCKWRAPGTANDNTAIRTLEIQLCICSENRKRGLYILHEVNIMSIVVLDHLRVWSRHYYCPLVCRFQVLAPSQRFMARPCLGGLTLSISNCSSNVSITCTLSPLSALSPRPCVGGCTFSTSACSSDVYYLLCAGGTI